MTRRDWRLAAVRPAPLRSILLLPLLLLHAACVDAGAPERATVSTDDGEAGVPIRLAGPGDAALLVPVRINGEGPYDFVLDTGATLTCVDRALADSLELPEASGRIGMGTGIGGQSGRMRMIQIDSVSVGDAAAEGLIGCAVDLGQFREMGLEAHGLLGLNFLTSFRIVLDFDAERLTLGERGR